MYFQNREAQKSIMTWRILKRVEAQKAMTKTLRIPLRQLRDLLVKTNIALVTLMQLYNCQCE